ncbi:hypothetical protein AAMO2058_000020100 [Amorphochlora amoebiformis]
MSRVRKRIRGFASDVREKLSRHEQMDKTDMFVLQKRKKPPKSTKSTLGKPPFRILLRTKPVYCVAFSYSEEEIMRMWRYCREDLPPLIPTTQKSKTLQKWIVSHFLLLGLEEAPASHKESPNLNESQSFPKSDNDCPQLKLANESKTKQRDPRRETKFTTTKPYNTSSSPFASLSPLTLANTLWSRRPSTMSVTGEGQVSIPIQGEAAFSAILAWGLMTIVFVREASVTTLAVLAALTLILLYSLDSAVTSRNSLSRVRAYFQVSLPAKQAVLRGKDGRFNPFSISPVLKPIKKVPRVARRPIKRPIRNVRRAREKTAKPKQLSDRSPARQKVFDFGGRSEPKESGEAGVEVSIKPLGSDSPLLAMGDVVSVDIFVTGSKQPSSVKPHGTSSALAKSNPLRFSPRMNIPPLKGMNSNLEHHSRLERTFSGQHWKAVDRTDESPATPPARGPDGRKSRHARVASVPTSFGQHTFHRHPKFAKDYGMSDLNMTIRRKTDD